MVSLVVLSPDPSWSMKGDSLMVSAKQSNDQNDPVSTDSSVALCLSPDSVIDSCRVRLSLVITVSDSLARVADT